MKYLIRAVKYFFSIIVIMEIILCALVLIGAAEADISTMFRNGYDSLWQIALLFAVISAVYPKFGFVAREAMFPGSWEENKEKIKDYMESRNYSLEHEEEGEMRFRHRGVLNRISRLHEDRITISSQFSGAVIEGLRKDVFRIAAGLEYNLNPRNTEE